MPSEVERTPDRSLARVMSRRSFLILAGSTSSLVLLAACQGAAPAAPPAGSAPAPTGAPKPAEAAKPAAPAAEPKPATQGTPGVATAKAPPNKDSLVAVQGGDISKLDPHLSTQENDITVSFNLFDNLTAR